MSFYRTVLAAVAAMAIASPVLADDTAAPAAQAAASAPAAIQTADASSAQPATTDTSSAQTTAAPSTTAAAASTVNLNKASAKDLMKVKGINASKARAIVAYRKKHGDFKAVDTLAKVKGFTKMKANDLQAIEGQLSID